MNTHRYAPADADALAPLLRSIGQELEERAELLAVLESRRSQLRARPLRPHELHVVELHAVEAEIAMHRREMRHCRAELERLGCSVVGTAPLTVRIPTQVGGAKRSRVWRHDDEGARTP